MSDGINNTEGAGDISSNEKWTILTPNVQIKTVEDLKEFEFQNNETGTIYNGYDYMMQQMGISSAQQLQKQEEHRKKTMKEITNS